MGSLEVSAKTVDEAIALALSKLGVSPSEVEVVVLNKGRPGFLGIGGEEATIKVTLLSSAPQAEGAVAPMAKEVLEQLLALMKIPAVVNLREEEGIIILDISGDDLGILIGRRGETLSSLQYLVNLIVSRRIKTRPGVVVDVDGYRRRRYESLRLLALRLAERVKAEERPISLEPMPPHERRIVHLALRDHPEVATASIGEGQERKVVISLKKTIKAA